MGGDQQHIHHILDACAFSAGARPDVGVDFLGQVLAQRVAGDGNRGNAREGQQGRGCQALGRLQHRIAQADIDMKALEGAPIDQRRDEETLATIGRGSWERSGSRPDDEDKPVSLA
jgi:hypothetical protein